MSEPVAQVSIISESLHVDPTPEVMPLVDIPTPKIPKLPGLSDDTSSISSTYLLATSGLAGLILIIVLFFLRKRSGLRRSTVLLVGPLDAGKTAIMSTLTYGVSQPTHTSLQPNFGQVVLSSSKEPVRLADIPGHPRIRAQFTEFISDAKGIIFVVDTSTIARNGAVVAEHLHTVLHALVSLPPSTKTPPLLIHAHKSDLLSGSRASATPVSTLAIDRVRTILERELEKRRLSNVGGVGVEGLGAENEEAQLGGLDCQGEAFKFEKWEGGEVEFGSGWVRVNRSDMGQDDEKTIQEDQGLDDLRGWIDSLQ